MTPHISNKAYQMKKNWFNSYIFLFLYLFSTNCENTTSPVKAKELPINDNCYFYVENTHPRDSAVIKWGNKQGFERFHRLSYEFSFDKVFCSDQRLILSFGCGSPCWAYIILPLNNLDSVQTLTYPLSNTDDYNIIVTASEETEGEIIVNNLSERKKGSVFIDSLSCSKTFYADCIEVEELSSEFLSIKLNDDSYHNWKIKKILNH